MSPVTWHRRDRMRIVVSEFISLDGVVQAPGGAEEDTDGGFGHGGWSAPFFDPEVIMAGAWPERAGDPFADWINGVQKYVVSDTLDEGDIAWGPTTVIRGADLVRAVSELRDRPGGDVSVWGSATLVRALLAADLVDELALMVEPVVLGGGKSIFPVDGTMRTFELASATTAKTGVQVCRYLRAG